MNDSCFVNSKIKEVLSVERVGIPNKTETLSETLKICQYVLCSETGI